LRGFVSFLSDNETMIAASCERLMKGVHYRGTYLTTGVQPSQFRTYWGYDVREGEREWGAGLRDPNSNFTNAVKRLRSYWVNDPGATERHLIAGCLLDATTHGPFFKLTLDVAEAIASGKFRDAPKRKTRRRKG
jgi:hypothetical protein